MTTMKQAWLMGKGGPWEVRDVPIPEPGPNEVLVKMTASSICNQTDLNAVRALHPVHDHQCQGMLPHHFRIWDNRIPDQLSDIYPQRQYPNEPYPSTMGHEGTGVVVKVGPRVVSQKYIVSEVPTINVGDRVSMLATVGGFGEYIVSTPDELIVVPDNVTDEEASLFEPVWVINGVVSRCVEMMDTVVILGQGALGLLTTQLARLYGAKQIIVSEPIAKKRELALKLGADIAIDPNEKNVVHEVEKITNGMGVNVVMECAGVPETIRMVPYLGAMGCKVGCVGACPHPVYMDWAYIHFRGMQVTSMMFGNQFHGNKRKLLQQTMEIIASHRIDLNALITHHYRLDDVEQAFRDVESGEVIKGLFMFDK